MKLRVCIGVAAVLVSSLAFAAGPSVPGAEHLKNAAEADVVALGEVLLTELNCVACHSEPVSLNRIGMKGAPDLSQAGRRMTPQYLRDFLLHPHTVRPGTTMPDLLRITDKGRDRDVDHLVHFLVSLGGPLPPSNTPVDTGMIERGRELFHRVGCVACHDAQQPLTAGVSSVPLEDVWRKTTVETMAEFLRDPLKLRHGGRMPSLRLTADEATAISAYLLRRQREGAPGNGLAAPMNPPADASFTVDEKLIPIGRRMFINLGCADCHQLTGYKSKVYAPTFARHDLDPRTGCLDLKVPRGLPMYRLEDWQREALKAALDARDTWKQDPTPARQVDLTLARLNCLACHTRGEVGGIDPARAAYLHSTLPAELGLEAKLPPTLTAAGHKLLPAALEDVLVNGRGYVRPHLSARMPQFGEANVRPLVSLLRQVDRPADASALLAASSEPLISDGRTLVSGAGLGCVNCHNLAGAKSPAIPGVDLATVPHRIDPDWYRRYMLNPQAYNKATRMPSFWAGGAVSIPGVSTHDAAQQIDAIWWYLAQLK